MLYKKRINATPSCCKRGENFEGQISYFAKWQIQLEQTMLPSPQLHLKNFRKMRCTWYLDKQSSFHLQKSSVLKTCQIQSKCALLIYHKMKFHVPIYNGSSANDFKQKVNRKFIFVILFHILYLKKKRKNGEILTFKIWESKSPRLATWMD
jgi:hypothetical protein